MLIEQLGRALFAIGLSYLIALLVGRLVSRIRLPKVTGYLLVGLLIGPSLAEIVGIKGLVSWETLQSIQILSELALALIMFIIGTQFKLESLRRWGRRLVKLSLGEMGMTFVLVFVFLFALNFAFLKLEFGPITVFHSSMMVALFGAIIAIAGAPAATLSVVREYESEGAITDLVLALLGFNNLIPIVLFTIAAFFLPGSTGGILGMLFSLLSPVALGFIGGVFISIWAQKLETQIEMLLLMMGVLIANIGAAHLWQIDFYLSCFTVGMIVSNASPKASRLISAVKSVDYPLYVMFFIIAGASLHFDALAHLGLLGVSYIVMRSLGKIIGSWFGARFAGFSVIEQRWIGPALLAQAGVAIGLAQSLARYWPEGGETVQTIVLGAVVLFEIVGPIMIRQALVRTGEVPVLTLFAKSSPESALEGLHHVVEYFRQSLGMPSGHKVESAGDILVQFVMRRNVETLKEDTPFNEILKFIAHSKYDRFPVTDRSGNYIGVVDYRDIRDVLVDDLMTHFIVARDLVNPEPLTVKPDQKLAQILEIFRKHSDISYLPVVTEDKKLAGIISQNDILATFRSSGKE